MSAGLAISNQPPVSCLISLEADVTAPELWSSIAGDEGFQVGFMDAVTNLDYRPGPRHELETQLHMGYGVEAVNGLYAGMLTSRTPGGRQTFDVLRLNEQFGVGEASMAGWPIPFREIESGPLAVLRASEWTPTVVVKISTGFESELRSDQREEVIWLLAQLARCVDLRIVASTVWQRKLFHRYREDLPFSEEDIARSPQRPAHIEECVERAELELNPKGRETHLLRLLSRESSETLNYPQLESAMSVDKSRVGQCLRPLRELDLVETFDGRERMEIEITSAGKQYVESVNARIGRQETLDATFSETSKRCDDSRVAPAAREDALQWEGGETPERRVVNEDEGETADEEAAKEATDRNRLPRYHQVRGLSRWRAAAVRGVAQPGGVSIVDQPFEEGDDRGEPKFYYDEDADEVVVGAQYDNPTQWGICVARSLASGHMFKHVLTPERIEAERLGEMLDDHADLLRDTRCLGYLADRDATAENYIEALKEAEQELANMTKEFARGQYEDRNAIRGDILRNALGLAGTVVHALDMCGVEVIRMVHIPRYSRDFVESDITDLLKTLSMHAAIQSHYGDYAAFRQLFEKREEKFVGEPNIDAADPFGQMIGSIVIAAPNIDKENGKLDGEETVATQFSAELRRRLANPREVRDDAPEMGIKLPVKERPDRASYAQTIRHMCKAKGLSPTREAVSMMGMLAGSPYDAAEALSALAPERKAPGRPIRLDEVRTALRTLEPARIMASLRKPALSKIVHALLATETPLNKAELANRAGVHEDSFRNHEDKLLAFDLMSKSGGGYYFNIPFRSDEEGVEDAPTPLLPWYVAESDGEVLVRDVLAEVVYVLVSDSERFADPDDEVAGALFAPPGEQLSALREAWEWVDEWIRLVEIAVNRPGGGERPATRTITFGVEPEQTSITDESLASP